MPAGEATEMKFKDISASLFTKAAEYIRSNALAGQKNSNKSLAEKIRKLKTNLDKKKFNSEEEQYNVRLQEAEIENQVKSKYRQLEINIESLNLKMKGSNPLSNRELIY